MRHAEAVSSAADLDELAEALNAAEADFFALQRTGLSGVPMDEHYGIDLTDLPRWGEPPKGAEGPFSWDARGRVLERAGNRWRVVLTSE